MEGSDSSHVMHTSTRDEGLAGVNVDLDVVDGISENQKTTMINSYRQQYQSKGYTSKRLPEFRYLTAVINLASGEKSDRACAQLLQRRSLENRLSTH